MREYLPALHGQESRAVIHENFGEAHDVMLKTCTRALAARQSIAIALENQVSVQTDLGTIEKARFWSDLVSDRKWLQYCKTLKGLADDWRAAVAA